MRLEVISRARKRPAARRALSSSGTMARSYAMRSSRAACLDDASSCARTHCFSAHLRTLDEIAAAPAASSPTTTEGSSARPGDLGALGLFGPFFFFGETAGGIFTKADGGAALRVSASEKRSKFVCLVTA